MQFVIVSIQWKPLLLPTRLYPQTDWPGKHFCVNFLRMRSALAQVQNIFIEHKKVSVKDNNISGLPFLDDKFQCFCLNTTRYACSCEDLCFSDTLHRLFSRSSGAFWRLFVLFEIGLAVSLFRDVQIKDYKQTPTLAVFFRSDHERKLVSTTMIKKKKGAHVRLVPCSPSIQRVPLRTESRTVNSREKKG